MRKNNYNKEGETKALYCKDCSEVGMVDVKSKKCIKLKHNKIILTKVEKLLIITSDLYVKKITFEKSVHRKYSNRQTDTYSEKTI